MTYPIPHGDSDVLNVALQEQEPARPPAHGAHCAVNQSDIGHKTIVIIRQLRISTKITIWVCANFSISLLSIAHDWNSYFKWGGELQQK